VHGASKNHANITNTFLVSGADRSGPAKHVVRVLHQVQRRRAPCMAVRGRRCSRWCRSHRCRHHRHSAMPQTTQATIRCTVSQRETWHNTLVHIFARYWPIFRRP